MAGLIALVHFTSRLTTGLLHTLDLLSATLNATADGLAVAGASIDQARLTVQSIQATGLATTQTIGATQPLVDALAALDGEDLPTSITATQRSLSAAASSAKVIDDVLLSLTAFPIFLGVNYDPPVPLHTGLIEVSDSLDQLSMSFSKMEASLNTTGDNLTQIEAGMAGVTQSLSDIQASLADAKQVIGQYERVVVDLQAQLVELRGSLPRWLRFFTVGSALGLVWLGIAQFGLLTQGLELIARSRMATATPSGTAEPA